MKVTLAIRQRLIEEKKEQYDFEKDEDESSDDDDDRTRGEDDDEVELPDFSEGLPTETDLVIFMKKVVYENHIWDVGFHLKVHRDRKRLHDKFFFKQNYCPFSGVLRSWLNQTGLRSMEHLFSNKRLCKNNVFDNPHRMMEHMYNLGPVKDCLFHSAIFYYLYYLYETDVKQMPSFKTYQAVVNKKVRRKPILFKYKFNSFLPMFSNNQVSILSYILNRSNKNNYMLSFYN